MFLFSPANTIFEHRFVLSTELLSLIMAIPALKQSLSRSTTTTPDKRRYSKQPSISKTVRFLVLSATRDADLPSKLPECDVLLHCGDIT
jgi:hypothetical protein